MSPDPRSFFSLYGVVLIIFVAISFATNSTLARISYDYGATPLSVVTWRTALAAFSVLVILKLWKVPIVLPVRIRWTAIGMGALVALYSYGLLGSIQHIPVALAVLTFYLYPILTSIGSWALGQERMTLRIMVCLIAAFIGLGTALDIVGSFNFVGISMASGAAVVFTVILLITNNLVAGQDSRPISLHMLSSATVIYIMINLYVNDVSLPSSVEGVAAYIGAGIFYAFAIIGMFVGIAKIGAIRTALLMNFEPVASIVLGVILLDQILTPLQLAGAGLVIGAIVVAALGKDPKVRKTGSGP